MSQPAIDSYDHPVFNPLQLRIETPAIKQLKEDLLRWVWTGTTGAIVSGSSQVGKSTAIEALSNRLYTRGHQRIPCFDVSIADRDVKTIASIFRNLCLKYKLRATSRDTADYLSARFIEFVKDTTVTADCQQIVLFVDEMQRLKPKQFNAFAEIHDELKKLQIHSTTVFVGNDPECWSLVERIEKKRFAHIHGRFFNQGTQFFGLTSEQQVKQCLSQYDKLRYPKGGDTYTEFFLPGEVHSGWKLASISHDLWRIFLIYKKELKLSSWPIKYFIAAVNLLLMDYLPRIGVKDIPDKVLHECIRVSGLIPSLVRPVT